MFAEAIEAILVQRCTPAAVRRIEAGGGTQALAGAIADAGFLELLTPEHLGGGGVGWRDFHDIVCLFGRHAVPLPLAQTLAARSLARHPQELPAGLLTFAPALATGTDGALHAMHVPMAQVASHVLAFSGDTLVVLDTSGAERVPDGIHGSLAASMRWGAGAGAARAVASQVNALQFQAIGALLHAGLLAGAMKRVFDMTMAYANERVQFGKPIGKFQAVQHQLSVMAEHTAAARMSAECAFATRAPLPAVSACAMAKARTSEAAQLVASTAHALHGAIGVTEEYDLQLYTRRLHEWRMAHGSEACWNRLVGRMFLENGQPGVIDFIRGLRQDAA